MFRAEKRWKLDSDKNAEGYEITDLSACSAKCSSFSVERSGLLRWKVMCRDKTMAPEMIESRIREWNSV